MWAYEVENFSELLSACDFSQAAVDVFKALHITAVNKPQIVLANALNFVYGNLPQDLVLTQEDRDTLTPIKQMAHLFDVSEFTSASSNVRFFSIDLGDEKTDRSYDQYAIHSIIARKSNYCSAAIFRKCSSVSLSVAYDRTSKPKSIYLSDWFELSGTEIDAFFMRIGVACLSTQNGLEFANDLIYLVARDYYTHPQSYEYLRFELDNQDDFLAQIIDKYGDDYVADSIVEENNKGIGTEDEPDFDLIEYDLEQMGLFELAEADDDFNEEYQDDTIADGEEGSVHSRDIPKDVLADPVLLLKWLEEHSAKKAGETEHDSGIISYIDAANIDYVDHRDKGGSLWIFGGHDLSNFVEKCKELGVVFTYKKGGGKATGGLDAWWS